ncbi:MAG: zinc-dependent alcohol dehydrogenase [Acidimicrobiales bacterium]
MKALRFERSIPRFVAARVAGTWAPGRGATVGPLRLSDIDSPLAPNGSWQRVRPRLAGICGSDLATIDGGSSRWFEPIVSFPFVPGHEIVGDLDDGTRVVLEPVLGCEPRGINPLCKACAEHDVGRCTNLTNGHLQPGLQTGYCCDTGGGWATALMAHESQLYRVPETFSDEAAVMVEPSACAIRGALTALPNANNGVVAVIGAGTLGLCTIAALNRWCDPRELIVGAKHPQQREFARDLGATLVVNPDELRRAVRRSTGSLMVGEGSNTRLAGGADVTVDCVGSEESLAEALAITRPGGRIVLIGMPGVVTVDLTPLWQRGIELVGAYAYGTEAISDLGQKRTFDLAFELVADARLERLVSATYPLDRYRDALAHAAEAGKRGAIKIAFDLRNEKERDWL